jgi:hypothetical protein
MSSWFGSPRPARPQPNPVDVARASLRKLSEQGIRIPSQVATPIIQAQKAGNLERVTPDLERRFWSAYGTLNSRIKPAEDAKNHYRRFFYGILTALLLLQLYHSASIAVQTRLIDVGKMLQASDEPSGASPEVIAKAANKKADLEREQDTYLHLTQYLMGFPRKFAGYLSVLGFGSDAVSPKDKQDVVAKVELELATSFVGSFLLPVLYGMLGAIAFVLRRLSDDNTTLDTARDARNRYSLRVPIGALSGLAAGWLLQPTSATVTSSLSPFALAFVAGYSAELVFAALDRIVAAFATAPKDRESASAGDRAATDLRAEAHEDLETEQAAEPRALDDASVEPESGGRAGPSSRAEANQDA